MQQWAFTSEAVNEGNFLEMTCRKVTSAARNMAREIQENTGKQSMIVLGSWEKEVFGESNILLN
jgi:hypothetical protein